MGKKGGQKDSLSRNTNLSVVRRNLKGESSRKLSEELGLDRSLICHCAKAYRNKCETGLINFTLSSSRLYDFAFTISLLPVLFI